MRGFLQIFVLILYISSSKSSIYSDVAATLSQYVKRSLKNIKDTFQEENTGLNSKIRHQEWNSLIDQPKTGKNVWTSNSVGGKKRKLAHNEPNAIIRIFKPDGKMILDEPNGIMNKKNRPRNAKKGKYKDSNARVKAKSRFDKVNSNRRTPQIVRRMGNDDILSTSDSGSSSLEVGEWRNEWKELWIKKKIEALNHSIPQGDVVNMVAARPWGVPCGDPGQHDMPWGSCMLAMECEAEYRIYRGDYQCGRTQFVCCAIQLTNYDMYQGFDISFDESGLSTDSEEQRNRGKGSAEQRRRRKEREKRRRRKARQKRKKSMKKNIKKIIKAIRKMLNRQFRNGTTQRKRKTKQLKKFIKALKKKYKKDRKSVQNIHEIEMVKIDKALTDRLKAIKEMNENFVDNATFREILEKGRVNKQGARMLVEAYPELSSYFSDKTRRSGDGVKQQPKLGPLDYDIEYGMLYY